uniref:Uncharacterized protein n=1 Tax=Sinocyclocheilus anshuiensis TaxID=1608454 RepID=A0A671RY21_9TELE
MNKMHANNHQNHDSHCGTDVARARWALLRQVRGVYRVTPTETDEPSEGQWVEYRSAIFPQYSALLRDNLGPIRVDEVLSSFDNTGNVCEYPFYPCPCVLTTV